MAFPIVESTNNWNSGTSGSNNHSVGLPSGINSGDLLIMCLRSAGTISAGTISTPSGWTSVYNSGSSNAGVFAIFRRTADGSEGSSQTVSCTQSPRMTSNTYRISGWNGFEVSSVTTSNDPENLTTSWALSETLWITVYGALRVGTGVVAPTNYANLIESKHTNTTSTTYSQIYSSRRNLTASSENPGTFTQPSNVSSEYSITIGVQGDEVAQNTGNFLAFM